MTETALTVVEDAPARPSALVLPVGTAAEMRHAMRLYEETKRAILEPSDYQQADGKQFIQKSGYAKLAIAFGVSSAIVRWDFHRTAEGALETAEFVVRATAPNGRYAEGWGSCWSGEGRFRTERSRQKIEHDLPATAETRARNRAYAALFGHGEVSYEEVIPAGDDAEQPSAGAPKASPYKPASANQLSTIEKLARRLGQPEEPDESMTSAEASERITVLSRLYNERKGGVRGGEAPNSSQAVPADDTQTTLKRKLAQDSMMARANLLAELAGKQPKTVLRQARDNNGIEAETLGDMSMDHIATVITWLESEIRIRQNSAEPEEPVTDAELVEAGPGERLTF